MSDKIKDLVIGEEAEVVGYDSGPSDYRSTLLSMGLTKGTVIKLLKVAPLGDPVEIEVRGFKLSLRKGEANNLLLRRRK
ncbi:MAG: FeoA domain-containing protein [Spirochaetales bacterium]|jgi:ferrous iron transport protein A|nr:FeoA domain-containing protein [Spirochaetales bacterium]